MDYNIKLLLLGDASVGKSSLLQRWTKPQEEPIALETIGINVLSHVIRLDSYMYKIRFWDTNGQKYYDKLYGQYIYNSDCIVLIYDTTEKDSWTKCKYWMNKIYASNGPKTPVYIVGNKIDKESKRIVHKADVQSYIKQSSLENIMMAECSAKTGENCRETYRSILLSCGKPNEEIWASKTYTEPQSNCIIV